MAGECDYDLIILDIAMPDLTGIDVVNKMRESNMVPKNKVVFFTASSQSEDELKNLSSMGVLDCMKKPFTKAQLLKMVAKHA